MLSVDPVYAGAVKNPQRWNRYTYALNRPTVMVDPDGRFAQRCTLVQENHYEVNDGVHFSHIEQGLNCEGGGGYTGPGGGGGGGRRPGPGPTTPTPDPQEPDPDTPDPSRPEPPKPDPDKCIEPGPRGENGNTIRSNMIKTRMLTLGGPGYQLATLGNLLRPGGQWDYKLEDGTGQTFGNQNYGAVMSALGMTKRTSLRIGGALQWATDLFSPKTFGQSAIWGAWPHGDAPEDAVAIEEGHNFGTNGGKCK